MKNNNLNGFTLIELLGTIIVLAIVALIATPIINNVIEKNRESAAKASGNNIIDAAKLYLMNTKQISGKVDLTNEQIEYSGAIPTKGEAYVSDDGKVRMYAYVNGYCVTKEYDETDIFATKTSEETCGWYARDQYSKENGTVITLDNKDIVDYKIYGTSIQQTRSGENIFNKDDTINTTINDKGITIKNIWAKKVSDNDFVIKNFKPNTTYSVSSLVTLVSKPTTLHPTANHTLLLTIYDTVAGTSTRILSNGKVDWEVGDSYKIVQQFTTPEDLSNCVIMAYTYYGNNDGSTTYSVQGEFKFDELMIVEGSYTSNNYPEYEEYGVMPPSEITNFGTLVTDTNNINYGKYKLDIKVTGKNLFDAVKDNAQYLVTTEILDDNIIKQTGSSSTNSGGYSQFKVYLTSGQYTISAETSGNGSGTNKLVQLWRNPNNSPYQDLIMVISITSSKEATFTVPTTGYYWLGVYGGVYLDEVQNFKIQIERGNTATDYESYQEKSYSIYLDEPLRCVEDVCDYIDYHNSKVIRNIKSEYITKVDAISSHAGTYSKFLSNISSKPHLEVSGIDAKGYAISNKFKSTSTIYTSVGNEAGRIMPYITTAGINQVAYTFANTSINTIELAQQEIGSGFEVQYILETPEEENIELPKIDTFDNINNVTVNDGVTNANIELVVRDK